MNLHGIVAPYVGGVNPLLPVSVRVSTGPSALARDGTRTPTYATPGALVGSIAGTVLTAASVSAGALQVGQTIVGAGVLPKTTITGLGTGAGGPGTYVVNQPQDVAGSVAMATALLLLGQVQPVTFRDIQQMEGLNLQGTRKAIYLTGSINGLIRVPNVGGDLITLPDGSVWLVALVLEGFDISAGWTKAAITLQDGS